MNSGQAYPAHDPANVGPPQVVVVAEGICRTFGSGHTAVHALCGVSFTVDRGQLVALRGRSGSGKTTLLNILGWPGRPDGGAGVGAATSASLASIANGGRLIALDASTAGKTILLRPDLSSLPVSALWPRIAPRPASGLVLPGQPERLEVLASLGAGPHSSPAEVRRDLGSVTVMAWVQDLGGAAHRPPRRPPL